MKKGIRVRLFHRYIYFYVFVLLWLPFLIAAFLYAIYQIMPDVRTNIVNTNVYVMPGMIAGSGLLAAIGIFLLLPKVRMYHLRGLARKIYNEKLYETDTVDGKERITYFPKIYYKKMRGQVVLRFPSEMGKFQRTFREIHKEICVAWEADLIESLVDARFFTYRFLTNAGEMRLDISDAKLEKTTIEYMRGMKWNFAKYPHALITGGTGSGKSFFLNFLIYSFYKLGAEICVIDPKYTDLSYLQHVSAFKNQVFCATEEIVKCVQDFLAAMNERATEFARLCNGKAGYNYFDFNLQPHVLFYDELSASTMAMDYKTQDQVFKALGQVILKGRQLGFFVVVGLQRPDAQYLPDGLRDQFGFRVGLGSMSELGYKMLFGSDTKEYFPRDRGFGYCSVGGEIITQMAAPFIDVKKFEFISQMERLSLERVKDLDRKMVQYNQDQESVHDVESKNVVCDGGCDVKLSGSGLSQELQDDMSKGSGNADESSEIDLSLFFDQSDGTAAGAGKEVSLSDIDPSDIQW